MNVRFSIFIITFLGLLYIPSIALAALVQEGFAFGDDDNSESLHTLDTEDTDLSEAPGSQTLRILIDATGDPASTAFKLKYQKNGTGGYSDVPVGSTTAGAIESGDVTNSGNNSTSSNPWTISVPSANTGDLILVNLAWDDSVSVTDVTAPSGQNGETAQVIEGPAASASTAVRGKVWYYITTGSWTAGTLSFTPNAAEQWTASVVNVPAGEFDSTMPIGASTNLTSTTTDNVIYCPELTAGASDEGGRIVCWMAEDADDSDGTASGWTNVASVDRGAVGGDLQVRDATALDSESIPFGGAWTLPNSRNWVSFIYIVRPPPTRNEIYIRASSNVTAGGEVTTARLPAPSGKTTGNFDTGRRWDDENGSDSIDITTDNYTELEWVLSMYYSVAEGDYFEFRVYDGDTPLDTYAETPLWTAHASISRTVRLFEGFIIKLFTGTIKIF